MTDVKLLKAIYETKREQILLAWLNPATREYVDDAYAYAYKTRIFPFFHLLKDDENVFAGIYTVEKECIDKVTEYLDTLRTDVEVKSLEFRILEIKFSNDIGTRDKLIAIFRYCFLSGYYKNHCKAIESNKAPPLEVKDLLTQTLTERDIRLI